MVLLCAACGREIDQSPKITKYQPLTCWHPELRKLNGTISSRCRNWDYDTFDRYDRNYNGNRKPLRLKDGRFLTADGRYFRYDNSSFFVVGAVPQQ